MTRLTIALWRSEKFSWESFFHAVLLVEETHDDFLHFIPTGDGSNTDIDSSLAEGKGEATVESFLSRLVHVRVVLQNRHKAGQHFFGCGVDDAQFSVDAGSEPDDVVVFLEVEIGGPARDRGVENPMNEFFRSCD